LVARWALVQRGAVAEQALMLHPSHGRKLPEVMRNTFLHALKSPRCRAPAMRGTWWRA